MSSEFDKINQDIRDFNTRIKTWNLDDLSDDEADEIADRLEETMELLAGEADDTDDESEEDDF